MIEPGRRRRMATMLVSGLAVAAVAGIAIAGTAMARNRQSGDTPAAGGGPGTPAAVQTPAPPTDSPTAASTPSAPSVSTPAVSTPAEPPATVAPGTGQTPIRKPLPPKPQEQQPPADPVAACKQWLKGVDVPKPGSGAKTVARLNGAPGTVLVLADSKYWAGCDTAYARQNGQGSIRQPVPVTGPAPGDAEAFTLANNLIPINGKLYEYYWAAGRVPAGVTKITYAFPDGNTTNAVIQGKYWLMQHQTTTPWKEGTPAPTKLIKVTLYGANGQPLRDFLMNWGEDTCAQINHGC
jgi:hypothetical protein